MIPATPKFAKEADLCAAFIATVDAAIWAVYPETEGWDILLSRKADGFQIGIEAKLRMNVEVINQVLDEYGGFMAARPGPDCRAILVPTASLFGRICDHLGIEVITASHDPWSKKTPWRFNPSLPTAPDRYVSDDWPEWCPAKRHKLPAYVPDVVAGRPAPVQLTEWKIKAIKLAIIIERRGHAELTDFKHLRMDHRRWLDGYWLQRTPGGLIPGKAFPDFKKMHPRNYGEIEKDWEAWKPPALETSLL